MAKERVSKYALRSVIEKKKKSIMTIVGKEGCN